MGTLPTERVESHGANSPIKGTTIDQMQDCIKGKKFNSGFPRTIGPFGETLSGTWNWNTAGTLYVVSVGGASSRLISLPVEKSERIIGLDAKVFGDGVADCTFTLFYADAVGQVVANLCTGTDLNRGAAWAWLAMSSLGAFTQRTMLEGEALMLQVAANAANYRLGNLRLYTDRL